MQYSGNEYRSGGGHLVDTHRLAYLRKRSLHRLWWSSAQVALKRGQRSPPVRPPSGFHVKAAGKRV